MPNNFQKFWLLALLVMSSNACNQGEYKDYRSPPEEPAPDGDDKKLDGNAGANSSEQKPDTNQQPAPEEPKPPQAPVELLRPTLNSIQRDLVDKKCVSCHQNATAANRHVALTDLSKVIKQSASKDHVHDGHEQTGLVIPGCPKQSFFLSIMKEGKMPPAPEKKISPDDLKTVEDWIVSLKPGNEQACESDDAPGGPDF